MADYDHQGGVGELRYYARAEMPSPCIMCDRIGQEKEICSVECDALTKWQIACGALPVKVEHKDVRKMGKSGEKLCGECGGKLRYEDGVIYCVDCLKVHMRLRGRETKDRVGYLLKKGWEITQVASVFGMDEGYIMVVGRRLGYSFPKVVERADKITMVDYALMNGAKGAAEKFGLHCETVNRYCRELGFGVKERYERLKVEAGRLYNEGVSVREVAAKLGVNWRTAKRWKKD